MLPKLMVPKFTIKLPSSGKEVTYRPFLVKEEKTLLIAVESRDQNLIINAIKDAISACVDDVDVTKLPYFDIEYLFLNLRAKSVGEEVKFSYKHRDGLNRKNKKCDVETEVSVMLDQINVKRVDDHKDKFMIDDNYGVKMKYPTIDTIQKVASEQNNEIELMASCIEYVYDNNDVHTPESLEESVKFIESMNSKQYEKLSQFFNTMPKLEHTIKYKCDGCGQEDEVVLSGISDFF